MTLRKRYYEALRKTHTYAAAAVKATNAALRADLRDDAEALEKAEDTIAAASARAELWADRAAALRAELVADGALRPTSLPL